MFDRAVEGYLLLARSPSGHGSPTIGRLDHLYSICQTMSTSWQGRTWPAALATYSSYQACPPGHLTTKVKAATVFVHTV